MSFSSEPSTHGESPDDGDPVARNRGAPTRTTPGRTPVGADVTQRLWRITGAILLAATLILVAVVVLGRGS